MMEHQKQWQFLKKSFESDSLGHAFLFSGNVSELSSFTRNFIKLINGKEYEGMIDANAFPDLLTVRSSDSKSSLNNDKDMMEISIEQVRQVQSFLAYTPYYGQFKSVIIENAERMSKEAQHSFLKTLEEPRGKTVIFLLAANADFLLETVRSRCQHMKFFEQAGYQATTEEQALLKDLEKIVGADLAEKFNYAKDANLDGGKLELLLKVMERHFRQMLLAEMGIEKLESLPKKSFSMAQIQKILVLIEQLSYQCRVANINKKMALEILLLQI